MQRKTMMMEYQIHLLFSFSFFFQGGLILAVAAFDFCKAVLIRLLRKQKPRNQGNSTSLYDSSPHASDFDCTTMNHAAFTAKA